MRACPASDQRLVDFLGTGTSLKPAEPLDCDMSMVLYADDTIRPKLGELAADRLDCEAEEIRDISSRER